MVWMSGKMSPMKAIRKPSDRSPSNKNQGKRSEHLAARKEFAASKLDMPVKESSPPSLSTSVDATLRSAQTDHRIIYDVFSAVTILEQNPRDVIMVLFPVSCDVTAQLTATLVKAYCRENRIAALQLEGDDWRTEHEQAMKRAGTFPECHCLLVTRPPEMTAQDKQTLDLCYREGQSSPLPSISIPKR